MTKSFLFENQALQKSGIGFNLVTTANSFNSLFSVQPLDLIEQEQIDKILEENDKHLSDEKNQIAKDSLHLKQLTAEIKAISKQGTLLMGERVYAAKNLLKSYREGTFTKWLETVFGSRKTGYNLLSYYEFYLLLPTDQLKTQFKSLQQKTAYILASREGNFSLKTEILQDCHEKSHKELIELIREKLPARSGDKRTRALSLKKEIACLSLSFEKIRKNKKYLNTEDKLELKKIYQLFSFLLQ